MKVLITNPDALLDPTTGVFYPGLKDVLDRFNEKVDQGTIVISMDPMKLHDIPKEYVPLHVNRLQRAGTNLIEFIKKNLQCEISEIYILGCKKVDVLLAKNSKLLLLRADYTNGLFESELIFEKGYGISIKDSNRLEQFLQKFTRISQPWYFKCEVSDRTTLYSLTNANTFHRASEITELSGKFRECLKHGDDSYREEFLLYFLVSTYAIINELQGVDVWTVYPSSTGIPNPELEYFKDKARQSLSNSRKTDPLFIRTKPTSKRQSLTKELRLKNGCDHELETLIVNPKYGNLTGKVICIIDDFTTYGTSCETARILLENAGVKKIVFLTLGKYGRDHYRYNYTFKGDPYKSFAFSNEGYLKTNGTFNTNSDMAFLESLKEIVR